MSRSEDIARTSIARLADCAPAYGECPDCGAPTAATRVLGFACEHYHCPMFAPIADPDSWPAREAPRIVINSCGTRPVQKSGGHGECKGSLPDDREAALGQAPHRPPYIDDTPAMILPFNDRSS